MNKILKLLVQDSINLQAASQTVRPAEPAESAGKRSRKAHKPSQPRKSATQTRQAELAKQVTKPRQFRHLVPSWLQMYFSKPLNGSVPYFSAVALSVAILFSS